MTDTIKQAMTLDDLRARRDEIVRLAEQHGASNVRVFGSVARGEARPDSDVDILVNFHDDASLYDVSGLRLALKELLNAEVDLVEEDTLKKWIRPHALKDAVPL
jgi:hypothetical protein